MRQRLWALPTDNANDRNKHQSHHEAKPPQAREADSRGVQNPEVLYSTEGVEEYQESKRKHDCPPTVLTFLSGLRAFVREETRLLGKFLERLEVFPARNDPRMSASRADTVSQPAPTK